MSSPLPSDVSAASGTTNDFNRPRSRRAPANLNTRSRLLWTSVLPAGLVTVVGVAAVAYLLSCVSGAIPAKIEVTMAAALVLSIVIVLVAAARARALGRQLDRNAAALRDLASRARAEVGSLPERVRRGDRLTPETGRSFVAQDALFAPLESDVRQVLRAAQEAVVEAVSQAAPVMVHGSSSQQVDVFVNLARRLQSLVHRAIQLLDDLENEVEDPDLLKGLFQVDHLATRIRRHAENLAVLGGGGSRRQWSSPVALTEVLRSAIAEVEQYPRVKLVPPIEGTLQGHAVADVVHLVAELVENATVFSPPQTQVLLRAQTVTAGIAIEVEDRGLGIPPTDRQGINNLLSDPDRIDIGELLRDGRLGLYVVSALARRHRIAVQQQANIYGGNQAVVVLPLSLIGPARQDTPQPEVRRTAAIPRQATSERSELASSAHAAEAQLTLGTQPHSLELAAAQISALAAAPVSLAGPLSANHNSPVADVGLPVTVTMETGAGGMSHHSENHDDRPELPRRVRQTHMVPRLRQSPVSRDDEPAGDHNPSLMATFMEGFHAAEADDDSFGSSSTPR